MSVCWKPEWCECPDCGPLVEVTPDDAGDASWRARTIDGAPLVPGVNVDPVNISAGLTMAATLGYHDAEAQMVTTYALQRWERGEEDGADQTWRSHYPHDFMSWRAILAVAIGSTR